MDDLGADLREARGLRPQVVDYPNAGGGRDRRVEMVDEAAEERFIGAQERMKPIENELRSFVQANLSELFLGGLAHQGSAKLLARQGMIPRATIGGYFERRLPSPYSIPTKSSTASGSESSTAPIAAATRAAPAAFPRPDPPSS